MRSAPALGAAVALAAGCVSLAPRPERTRYYVLDSKARSTDAARASIPVLGVGPVRLPPYLDRPEIVTRAGPTRLEVASDDCWAAPLDSLFASALAEDLRAAVPAGEVLAWPWPVGSSSEWSVSVDVVRFDRESDGAGILEARWTVFRAGALARQGVTNVRELAAAPGMAATVSALSNAIAGLARDIAAGIDASRQEERRAPPQ